MDPEESEFRAQRARAYRAESLEQRDARAGYVWWEELSPSERGQWMKKTKSSIPMQCWEAYKRSTRG